MRSLVAVASAAVLLAGCADDPSQRPPAASDDGLALTGRLSGAQVSVSDGEPEVLYGDCDRPQGDDVDLCIGSFTIDGSPIGFVIENPAVLEEGARLQPVTPQAAGCPDTGCDDVTDGIVIQLRRGTDRQSATSGTVTVREADPRYAASFQLRFPSGSVSGTFNVAPPVTP